MLSAVTKTTITTIINAKFRGDLLSNKKVFDIQSSKGIFYISIIMKNVYFAKLTPWGPVLSLRQGLDIFIITKLDTQTHICMYFIVKRFYGLSCQSREYP